MPVARLSRNGRMVWREYIVFTRQEVLGSVPHVDISCEWRVQFVCLLFFCLEQFLTRLTSPCVLAHTFLNLFESQHSPHKRVVYFGNQRVQQTRTNIQHNSVANACSCGSWFEPSGRGAIKS